MDKLKFRRSGIQARVLALTMFFTLGASLVIAASNMHQMTAEWERTTILNAEYALQTAASAIRRDVDEIDDLAGWCAYNPGMRTYLLTGDTASNQALSMYPTVSAKFNSMRTLAYIQRFLLINASGRQMMFGTAATSAVTLTPDILQRIPGYDSPNTGWDCILRDPLALNSQAANTIPVTHTLTLPGTDRTAHVCIFVSPSLILSPLRSFTLADGGQLYWEMGENLYTINGSLLSALNGSIADFDDAVPLDSNTLDPNTEVYTRGSGSSAQLVVRYPIGIHELYLIEVLPNGPTQRQITFVSVPLLISLTAILLLGCSLAFLLHRMIAHPISALQSRIEKISGGDFSADPDIEWDNELGVAFKAPRHIVAVGSLQTPDLPTSQLVTLSTGVTRMAAETLPKYRPCRVTAMDLRHFSVLLPLEADEDPETVLAPILKTAGQILYNYFSTAIYWAVGRPVNDILKISESQHDAFAALPLLHEGEPVAFYHESPNTQLDHRAQVVGQVQQYIRDHLSERLTLNDVAAVFNFSPNYLSQLFAQNSESGFVEFVTATRITAAKELMASTDLKVYEISDKVGFDSAFYFSKVFKKLEGVSPREYMQRMKVSYVDAKDEATV